MSEEITVPDSQAGQSKTSNTPPGAFTSVTPHITADTSQEVVAHEEQPPADVLAFCSLLARIVMRCLNQRDARVLKILSLSSHQRKTKPE